MALVWRDEDGRLRCRRSPGSTQWYVTQPEPGLFELWDRPPPGGESGERVVVGRIDPETAEAITRFLLAERRSEP